MSIIVDSIVDQYPIETLSFDNLPQESPVAHLDYGGILSQIGELVKKKQAVDYLRLVTIFVGKNEQECKRWLDRHRPVLVKLGIPYEVGSS